MLRKVKQILLSQSFLFKSMGGNSNAEGNLTVWKKKIDDSCLAAFFELLLQVIYNKKVL